MDYNENMVVPTNKKAVRDVIEATIVAEDTVDYLQKKM